MDKAKRLYTLGVLWLLSVVAQEVAAIIYAHGHDDGHEDGSNEVREFMRRELLDVQRGLAEDRARSYRQGFADAMRMYDDEPVAEPVERMH